MMTIYAIIVCNVVTLANCYIQSGAATKEGCEKYANEMSERMLNGTDIDRQLTYRCVHKDVPAWHE